MALENYTTYSEYDENGLVTVGANTLAVEGYNDKAFSVHKVFAAGHFSGDFEHVVAVKLNDDGASNLGLSPFWGLSNETAESAHSFKQIKDASGDCLYMSTYETSTAVRIQLAEISTGTEYSDQWIYGEFDTWYYCEIERDESTGTYGKLLCRIYSDESRSTLVDTLSVTLHEKEDFRTVYAVASFYPGTPRPYSQNIKNLDLQEAGTTHTVTGAITLPALTVSGTASKKHVYTATGAVTLPALEVSGEAAKKHIYNVTGAIELPALEVAGEAARSHTWEVTGDITLPALEVAGEAQSASGKVTHEVTGAIVLPALEVLGEATRFHSWEVKGAVTLPALEVNGQAAVAMSLESGGETDFQAYSSEDEDYVTGMALVDGGLLLAVDWKQRATEAECL